MFLISFAVDHVLITRSFHHYTTNILAQLEDDPRLSFSKIYDENGYAIYEIHRSS